MLCCILFVLSFLSTLSHGISAMVIDLTLPSALALNLPWTIDYAIGFNSYIGIHIGNDIVE